MSEGERNGDEDGSYYFGLEARTREEVAMRRTRLWSGALSGTLVG
jgi:hypothetical protein